MSRLSPALLTLLLTFLATVAGAEPVAAAGRWEGAIRTPGAELRVLVDLAADSGGGWSGTIDIPQQGAKGLALAGVKVEGASVAFAIAGIPGDPTFRGSLVADGGVIEGKFTQGGAEFPFRLERPVDPRQDLAGKLEEFRGLVRRALADFGVPAVSIALVKDDVVVLCEGFGLRDVEKKQPATAETLFAIGSCTKAFTALSVGLLVDDGRLDWDAKVRDVLPGFRLHDRAAEERITARDLLCHRSGLPRHDLVWYNAPGDRAELVKSLRWLEPSADLRARWQYQNLMFMAAGHLAGERAGMSWEDLVRTRIFQPLGMTRSNFSVEDSQKSEDHARPYVEQEKQTVPVPFRNISAVGPAGSINSCARDMAQWLRLQLGDGEVDGKRVVSSTVLRETHQSQMLIPRAPGDPEISHHAYALGWITSLYRGREMVEHGGNIDGFTADIALIPSARVGVAILSNHGRTSLPSGLAFTALDLALGLEPIDWCARMLQRKAGSEQAGTQSQSLLEQERKPGTKPAHPLEEYAAEYEHPAYGVMRVRVEGNTLAAEFHGIPLALEHWHFETFRAVPQEAALAQQTLMMQFLTNLQGNVDRLSAPLEPLVPEIVFRRRPPARLSDPAFLRTLLGSYRSELIPTLSATVSLRGESTLTVTLPGQPTYELLPVRGTEFRIRTLEGFHVRFELDAAGAPIQILFVQPNGVFAAKRVREEQESAPATPR